MEITNELMVLFENGYRWRLALLFQCLLPGVALNWYIVLGVVVEWGFCGG